MINGQTKIKNLTGKKVFALFGENIFSAFSMRSRSQNNARSQKKTVAISEYFSFNSFSLLFSIYFSLFKHKIQVFWSIQS